MWFWKFFKKYFADHYKDGTTEATKFLKKYKQNLKGRKMEKHKQIMNTIDLEKDKKERTKLKSS